MLSLSARRSPSSHPSADLHRLVEELRADLRTLLPVARASKTLARLAEDWLPRKLPGLASSDSFEGRVRNHLLPAIGQHTSATLRKRHVQAMLQALVERGLSLQTANHVRDAGRQLVEDALDNEDWFGPNPFAKVAPYKIETPDYERLSRGEAAKLLRSVPLRWRSIFAVALYLGPRRKTIFNIRRVDVDFRQGVIDFLVTKTGTKIRRVPIPRELEPHLRRALRVRGREWLFVNRFGNKHGPTKRLNIVLQLALKKAGIERTRFTFHSLRRCSSVLHQEAGAAPWVVSRVLGHSQASLAFGGSMLENTTAKKYSPFSEQFVRRELNKLSLK